MPLLSGTRWSSWPWITRVGVLKLAALVEGEYFAHSSGRSQASKKRLFSAP